MIFYSGSRYQEYLEIMEGEIEKLEKGDLGRLRSVYGVFATQDDQLIQRAGEAVRQKLSPMTDLQLLGLCRRFGSYTLLEWSINLPRNGGKPFQPTAAFRRFSRTACG